MLNLKHYDLRFMPGDIAYRANNELFAVEKVLIKSSSIKFEEHGVGEFYEFMNDVTSVFGCSDGSDLYDTADSAFKFWT